MYQNTIKSIENIKTVFEKKLELIQNFWTINCMMNAEKNFKLLKTKNFNFILTFSALLLEWVLTSICFFDQFL